MIFKLLVALSLLAASSCRRRYGCGPEWDALKVTYSISPFRAFQPQPRTVEDALDQGFVKVGDCDSSATATHRGARYIKNGDTFLVLLYDINGIIAGIQTVVPKGLPNGYPSPNLRPPFIEMDDGYYLTAYFVPPETICSTGRSNEEYADQGTGTVLYIQNGSNPDIDYMSIAKYERDVEAPWEKHKCYREMGMHYWYGVSEDMDCENFFPVFLLYNEKKLNAFGWAMVADLPSPVRDYGNSNVIHYFINNPPICLRSAPWSTLRIYLTDNPRANRC